MITAKALTLIADIAAGSGTVNSLQHIEKIAREALAIDEAGWQFLGRMAAQQGVRERIIQEALKTPYFDLDGYMERYWLFNPFDQVNGVECYRVPELPSIRIHHILRADLARHPHDHPWNARTIILKGWYKEVRDGVEYLRVEGDTATLNFGEYHHISEVSPGGVWTMFIMDVYEGGWGFLVDGVKVPWREYEAHIA